MISILLATYNGEKYIKECIDSIINQTFTEWELLVGFNGTTDGSKEIVNGYNDPRIRTFDYGDDKGKAKTLNKLIKESKYDWCAMQDDDDIWIENKLEEQIKYIDQFDVIGTFIRYIDRIGNLMGQPNLHTDHVSIVGLSLRGDNQVANSSSIFRKSSVLNINSWDEELEGLEDFDLWLRLIKSGNKFINIPKELVLHRLHSGSNFNTNPMDVRKIIN